MTLSAKSIYQEIVIDTSKVEQKCSYHLEQGVDQHTSWKEVNNSLTIM